MKRKIFSNELYTMLATFSTGGGAEDGGAPPKFSFGGLQSPCFAGYEKVHLQETSGLLSGSFN